MIKKIKCHICNYKFYVDIKQVKEVYEKIGVINTPGNTKTYNAIDCPNCGCQKILWPRFLEVKQNDKNI